MKLIMCVGCGEFVPGLPADDGLEPQTDECPDCGGTTFRDPDPATVDGTTGS